MQILNFTDFAALPAGTVFSYYKPTVCDGLFRKGETISWDDAPHDFFEASLVPNCWNGDEPTVDNIESRWGLFNYDQLFAVFETQDIETLRTMLSPPTTAQK